MKAELLTIRPIKPQCFYCGFKIYETTGNVGCGKKGTCVYEAGLNEPKTFNDCPIHKIIAVVVQSPKPPPDDWQPEEL